MFFRPLGQSGFPIEDDTETPPAEPLPEINPPVAGDLDPVVALLDGLPLANHTLLADRLTIDDPDDHASRYQPGQQRHGTAMASLIIHGDRSEESPALQRPLYVRPILAPAPDIRDRVHEYTPDDVLLVNLIHRSVRRIKEGDGDEAPTGPAVKIINLSFGNPYQPFDRDISPLARLLDWLSWKYQVLFLVSAGNMPHDITISKPTAEWRTLASEQLRDESLRAMAANQIERRPLSPAESINVVTVGAVHADLSTPPNPDRRVDLFRDARLISPLSTVASGFNRAVKPEILFPGGRQLYHAPVTSGNAPACFTLAESLLSPGQKVAFPGQGPMELSATAFTRGTSNATALATRSPRKSMRLCRN